MSNRRALCIGINVFKNYPGSTLNGCVNDANQMAGILKQYLGFAPTDIKVLTDAQATKQAIIAELTAMVAGAKTGKYSYLVFSLSSHGTQVPDKNGDEADHYDEAFCPHDLAATSGQWDPNHVILDDELHDLFAQVPDNVLIEVYLDTCHSGTGLKAADLMPDRRPRYIAPPSIAACEKVATLMARGMRRRVVEKAASNVILWGACRDNQTSADAYIGGSYHGAFTYYWVRETTAANNNISRNALLKKVNADLSTNHYSQVAQLECPATQRGISPK
ncbi:MAG: caspase family protein [Proteobacteria bacterium]|nr:caspase family protein [Pseudomonadota bacterium]